MRKPLLERFFISYITIPQYNGAMPPEEITFQIFFAAKLKDRGISIKKLSEATGITPAHLEALAQGRFDDLPAAPYVHGYLVRLGKILDFNGEESWEKIKTERTVQNSGSTDTLPSNRFIKQAPMKFIWIGVVAVIVVIYLAFQIPAVFSGPRLKVSFPPSNPYSTSSSTVTLTGTVQGTQALSLSNGSNGDSENITVNPDGSWQKAVLLQDGQNTFEITAKKLLGGQTVVTEQILYQDLNLPPSVIPTSSPSSTLNPSSPTSSPTSSK